MHLSDFYAWATQTLFLLMSLATAREIVRTTTITTTVATRTSTTTIPRNEGTTLATRPGAPAGLDEGPYSPSDLRSSVLNSTNYYRSQYMAKPLGWDSTLADYAHNHAQECIWEHSGGPYGENLALNFRTPTLGVDAWAAEERKYRYPNEGFSEDTGHWTQLVWQNTTHVGCAAVNCNSNAVNGAKGWFLVCEYSPPGNVEGQYLFNVQKPGESEDGKLGFGAPSAASRFSNRSLFQAVLATVISLAVSSLIM